MNLLRNTLAVNATTSAVTGLILAAGAVPLSDWLGITGRASAAAGLGLLVFAAYVASVARNPRTEQVRHVIAADIAWVVGAFTIVIAFPDAMSAEGVWALGVVSTAVAVFAVLQTVGLRRSRGDQSVGALT